MHKGNKAVFLDSDGVLNNAILKNGKPCAPLSISELVIPDEVKPALERLKNAGYILICITNKPDVSEGLMTRETLDSIYVYMRSILPLDDVFMCLSRQADCYKPKPGMILEGAKKHHVDLSKSFMIGDTKHDIGAGKNAGCKTIWIDRHYDEHAERHPNPPADFTTYSLAQSVDYILASH